MITQVLADLRAQVDKLERELEGCKHPDIAIGMAYCAADDARQEEIDKLKANLTACHAEIASLRNERDGLEAMLNEVHSKLTVSESRISAERKRREKAEAWMNHLRNDSQRHVDVAGSADAKLLGADHQPERKP